MKMHSFFKIGAVSILLLLMCIGCKTDPEESSINFSGTYYTTIGPDPLYVMVLNHSGNNVTFTLGGYSLDTEGVGTVDNNTVNLATELAGFGSFIMTFTFSEDGNSFSGTWDVEGPVPMYGTITGTKTAWATYDIESGGIPQFVQADCIDLDKIKQVSKFRSGMGHDYSDEFEICRSMKHYFEPKTGVDMWTIRMYSPVTGTVNGFTDEFDDTGHWKGKSIGIIPDGYPAFWVKLFHVDPDPPLTVGQTVTVGQQLGTSEKEDGTAADIAVGVRTPDGYRLVSYFQVMTDNTFIIYQLRGVVAKEDLIITEAERDTDILQCDGEQFITTSTLADWVVLN